VRDHIPQWETAVLGLLSVVCCLGIWWFVTLGAPEERMVGPLVLPSPGETWDRLPELLLGDERPTEDAEGRPLPPRGWSELWHDFVSESALARNLYVTLRRLLLGFGLAIAVGVPLGVLAGCFARVHAFLQPVSIFGRNIPLAALVGVTFSLFGIGELQKVMFIFLACVAFVLSDTSEAIRRVESSYIDTALTLGARPWQVILKVLLPLALPSICNSLRLMFGLAFGYIMLAETIKFGSEAGGLGHLINTSIRRGLRENVFLVLLLIPLVALAIDQLLFGLQRQLFPHVYGGKGWLHRGVRAVVHGLESGWQMVFSRRARA
jgi:NitT/TauT family transport system permease protein